VPEVGAKWWRREGGIGVGVKVGVWVGGGGGEGEGEGEGVALQRRKVSSKSITVTHFVVLVKARNVSTSAERQKISIWRFSKVEGLHRLILSIVSMVSFAKSVEFTWEEIGRNGIRNSSEHRIVATINSAEHEGRGRRINGWELGVIVWVAERKKKFWNSEECISQSNFDNVVVSKERDFETVKGCVVVGCV